MNKGENADSPISEAFVDTPIDLMTDLLADAPLSVEQRGAWDTVRAELIIARERLQELEERLKKLEHVTHENEPIPAMLTRPEFNREVARMLAFDERYGGTSSVLYFDVENLPDIHRELGGPIADAVVRVICDTLAHHIRSSDILGRLATDEFGVLLARCDNSAAWRKGETLADILHEAVAKIPGCTIEPMINYGAYTFSEKENVATGLKRAAEGVTRTGKDAAET